MKAPIVSTKHYVQFTEFTVASATVAHQGLIVSQAVASVDAPNEVQEGSVVKALYYELWLQTGENDIGSFVVTIQKHSNDSDNPTFTEMTTLNAFKGKKDIFFTSQGLLANSTSNPTPVHRGWIKIPKGKQRMGLEDRFKVHVACLGSAAIMGCAFATYKEYR